MNQKEKPKVEPNFFTTAHIGQLLGLSRYTIYKMVPEMAQGGVRFLPRGKRGVLVEKESFESWIESRMRKMTQTLVVPLEAKQ